MGFNFRERPYWWVAFGIGLLAAVLLLLMWRESSTSKQELTDYLTESKHLAATPADSPTGQEKSTGPPVVNEENGNTVATTPFEVNLTVEEIAGFNPNHGILWPGALVQGASLLTGTLAAVPVEHRVETVVLSTLGSSQSPTLQTQRSSEKVYSPAASTVEDARLRLISQALVAPAKLSYIRKQFYSLDHALLQIGARASWMGGGMRASLDSENYKKNSNILVKFTQEYYTLAAEPPRSPTAFFASSVKTADLLPYSNQTDNPITYVQSVTYGRMAMLLVSSSESYEKLDQSLQAALSWATGDAAAEYNSGHKNVVQNSEVKLVVLGGSASEGLQVVNGDPVAKLHEWIEENSTGDAIKLGIPISYRINYLADNQPARMSFTTDYTRVSVTPIPRLSDWRITFQTGDDDKDDDTMLHVAVLKGDTTIAHFDQQGKKTYDNGSTNTEVLTQDNPLFVRDVGQSQLRLHIDPNGNDTWRFNYTLVAQNSAGGNYVQSESLQLKEDHRDENRALHP